MKRMMIMLLIACSATITASAQKKATVDNTPYNVKALFYNFLKTWGSPADEVYSVNRNPNTNQIESSVKITYFVANVNTGSVRQNMSAIGEAFKKDESKAYQLLHLAPGSKETFALGVYNENGEDATYLVRGMDYEEMWLLCSKNQENPKLRDAYAIKWSMNDDKSKALGAIYQITSLRPDLYVKALESNKRMFKIVGRVDENIKDSLYNIYIADSREALYNLEDHEYVACIPVVNKRFEWQTELTKPCVGRLRCIFPDGSLCSAWIDLDFVPGETYNITVHNGYYDEDKDYERRVGRNSGKSLLNTRQIKGNDDVVVDTVPVVDAYVEERPTNDRAMMWRESLSPKLRVQFISKAQVIETYEKVLKQSYDLVGQELNGMRDPYHINGSFDRIYKQNKTFDNHVQDFVKFCLNNGLPKEELPDLYKVILDLYSKQNQAIAHFYKEYGAYTKSARKVQKQVNSLTEKYMNEMTKAMR